MSLRFITGRAGSGKTTLCLKEINYMQEKGVTDTLTVFPSGGKRFDCLRKKRNHYAGTGFKF